MNKGSWDIDFDSNTEIKQDHLEKVYACRRRVFTTEEDKILADLVASQSCTNWFEIAQKIEGKTARQCRDRWTNYLSPSNSFAPWTVDEDRLIVTKVNEFGTKWSTIAKYVEGRSDNTIKNRWYSGLKKNCVIDINGRFILKCDKQAAGASASTTPKPTTTNAAQRSQGKFTARAKASPQNKKAKSASFFSKAPQLPTPSAQTPSAQTPSAQLPTPMHAQTPSQSAMTAQIQMPKQAVTAPISAALSTPTVPKVSAHQNQQYQQLQPLVPQQQSLAIPTYASTTYATLNPNSIAFQQPSILETEQSLIPFSEPDCSEQYQFVLPNMPLLFNPATMGFQPSTSPHLQSSSQSLPLIFPHIPLVQEGQQQFQMKSDLEMETLENDFWDRQLINQVTEMSQDPFQIPELYGEWF